jgi:hypothetical protein
MPRFPARVAFAIIGAFVASALLTGLLGLALPAAPPAPPTAALTIGGPVAGASATPLRPGAAAKLVRLLGQGSAPGAVGG